MGRSERGRLLRVGRRGWGGGGTGEWDSEGSFSLWEEDSESESESGSEAGAEDEVVLGAGSSVGRWGGGGEVEELEGVAGGAWVLGVRVGRVFITMLDEEAGRVVFDSSGSSSSRSSVPASSPRFFASTTASLSSAGTVACMEVMSFAWRA